MFFNYIKRCDINTHAKPVIYKALTSVPESERVELIINTNLLDEEIRIDLLTEIVNNKIEKKQKQCRTKMIDSRDYNQQLLIHSKKA